MDPRAGSFDPSHSGAHANNQGYTLPSPRASSGSSYSFSQQQRVYQQHQPPLQEGYGAAGAFDEGTSTFDARAGEYQQANQQQVDPYYGGGSHQSSSYQYSAYDYQGSSSQMMDPSASMLYGDMSSHSLQDETHLNESPLLPLKRMIEPQLFGAPASAVAYDTAFEAVFVASETNSMSRSRLYDHRSSMLATHSTVDGSLYSSVAGHPEAPPMVLKTLYNTVYSSTTNTNTTTTGGGGGSPPSSSILRPRKIPNHAFRPHFGASDPGLPTPLTASNPTFQMGIRQLLPLGGGGGRGGGGTAGSYVASVSPAAVRIHSNGGLQVADFHTEGMLAMTEHPQQHQERLNVASSVTTHVTVGGMALGKDVSERSGRSDILCLDAWQGLRVVASYSTSAASANTASESSPLAVTCLATSHQRGSVVAGCSDGTLRVLDNRLREVAKLKSHLGGVVDVAVSDGGNLLATTGYGSRGSGSSSSSHHHPLYSFPNPNILFFDLRFLGRGSMSHSFTGLNGGPRYLSFLPSGERLLAVSGQVAGGMQVIENMSSDTASSFIVPQLLPGESITAMDVEGDRVGLGTSKGGLLEYRIADSTGKSLPRFSGGSTSSSGMFVPSSPTNSANVRKSGPVEKALLQPPSFAPPLPELSIDPALLLKGHGQRRNGANDLMKSIVSAYVMTKSQKLSSNLQNFGPLASEARIDSCRNQVSDAFFAKSVHSMDFVRTVPTADLGLDLFEDHRPEWVKAKAWKKTKEPLQNPNKFLYNPKLYASVYKESFARFKKKGRRGQRATGDDQYSQSLMDVPPRYRRSIRPSHKSAAAFSHAEHNDTNFSGWNYAPDMPNAFVSPIVMLLYFVPEARQALLKGQFSVAQSNRTAESLLSEELSFLFHRIESITRHGMIFQPNIPGSKSQIGVWAPSNLVACLSTMPEAEQLQILDGSPAAVETPRRPEAFYRFLLYQIDKEMNEGKLMDELGGVDFVSVNEFNSKTTAPTTSWTRAMTVELLYEPFIKKGNPDVNSTPSFGEVLYRTLYRETPLRAYNKQSGSYETIVQRKVASTLPKIMSLSCSCAGRKEEEGLFVWRGEGLSEDHDHWLPECIEVEITETGNLLVRELVSNISAGTSEWVTYGDKNPVSSAVADILAEKKERIAQKIRYRLEAVVSNVRDELDKNIPDEIVSANDSDHFGHHVLHVRIPQTYEEEAVMSQRNELASFMEGASPPFTLVDKKETGVMQDRLHFLDNRLQEMRVEDQESGWVLFNGFNVSRTSVEDARAFHVGFKEPCLVVFRSEPNQTNDEIIADTETTDSASASLEELRPKVPLDVVCTRSITNNLRSNHASNQKLDTLPGQGDLVAFDAEFVSVQEEVSTLSETGSRVTIQETRHAIARISAISCQTRAVLFDDFVLPLERVVDHLTRFSGIVEQDLDPKESQRHLISTRAAYLKMRCLVERGVVFVGHGLSRDFWILNLHVPPNQIIDTVEIYHKPAQRYVSLRFLTNFVLKRDMQQEVHDSLEDATAAYELYETAVTMEEKGEFDKLVSDLYVYGTKVDWKLGME